MRKTITKRYDLVVVGGGVGGIIAAVTAVRHGLHVALVNDKPGLGGNASSDIGVSIDGAICFNTFPNMREGGPVEELKEQIAALDPMQDSQQNSTAMLFFCEREPRLDVFNELLITSVRHTNGRIQSVAGHQSSTERSYKFTADQFVDATGDGSLAAWCGCTYRMGRESSADHGETLAPATADAAIMGSSLLFRASNRGIPIDFEKPAWAYTYTRDEDLPYRLQMQRGPVRHGFWWLEYAGDDNNPIVEHDEIRKELLKVLYGVWSYLKNDPARDMRNWALDSVTILPAKRESRRIMGDYVLTQSDIVNSRPFDDAVAYGGWNIDVHVPGGFKAKGPPNVHAHFPWVFTIPLRCLYARDLDNLWLVGRDMSVTHVALGATRLQATIGLTGHAVGVAAAWAKQARMTTRETARQCIRSIQQDLLKDGSFLPGIRNEDPADCARRATVTTSSAKVLTFEPSDDYDAIGRGKAVSFPLPGGRLDRLSIPLRNNGNEPACVRLQLAPSAHPNDFDPTACVATKEFLVPPGCQTIVWECGVTDLKGPLCALFATTAAGVDWMLARETPYGAHVGDFAPEFFANPKWPHVFLLTPDGRPRDWVRKPRHRTASPLQPDGRARKRCPAVSLWPTPCPYEAANTISGCSHTNTLPDLWVSDPAQPLPQAITLAWDQPQPVSSVRLVFDNDSDMNHPSGYPVETLVKTYRVLATTAAGIQTVVQVEDNRERFRIHAFETVTASAITLQIESVHAGGREARVFEIRCYG